MKQNPLMKKALCCVLAAVFVLGMFTFGAFAADVCPTLEVNNINDNDYYYYWSNPSQSYLIADEDGYMRFQANAVYQKYFVEYYDKDYNITSFKTIPQELSIFGGFYSDGNYYYVVSGNKNPQELATVECFRITKYDKSWNKIKSVGLFDCNTYIPFDAGNLRFAHSGNYLFIRTAHEMYMSDDGYHQANVTIQVDTEAMTIVDEMTDVANVGAGYVSHSFNQFILIENNQIIALDHGDAYPRSVVLLKYTNPVSENGFSGWNTCSYMDAIPIPGSFGDNYTGIEVGGFEYSDSKYIIAYSSVKLDDNFRDYSTKNLYITTVDKLTDEISTKQITHFAEGENGVGCPQIVKISSEKFMLLWAESGSAHYCLINGSGDVMGAEYAIENAALSDCVPLYHNNKIVWYTCNNSSTTIYEIDVNNIGINTKTDINSGHNMKVVSYPSDADPYCEVECEKCGFVDFIDVCSNIGYCWSVEDGGEFEVYPELLSIDKGGRIYFVIYKKDETDTGTTETVFTLDDGTTLTPVMVNDHYGYLTLSKEGEYILTATHKYAPDVSYSVNVSVGKSINTNTNGLGDVNLNGKIDARDYLLLKRAYFGTYSFNAEQNTRGDINGNGKIDARDYLLLKRIYFGTYTIG